MFSKLFLLALPLVLAAPAVKHTEGDITFYTPGQGACAGTHGVDDMVAAVGANLYDTQDVCGKTITLQGDAGTVTLTVVEQVASSYLASPTLLTYLVQPLRGLQGHRP
ncbi:hypothetical protein FNAPI_12389 [Fusarium napiforme]|uniref:Uncharacterized protein n=1 Tax=Fusarium napiforme TaxID=42672 RepID=A0A8H5IEL4_9HYPO|nr:hypothetical protein FNAPI_12389 [Fusarium napiforme]